MQWPHTVHFDTALVPDDGWRNGGRTKKLVDLLPTANFRLDALIEDLKEEVMVRTGFRSNNFNVLHDGRQRPQLLYAEWTACSWSDLQPVRFL
jgi:hypothetical protein